MNICIMNNQVGRLQKDYLAEPGSETLKGG